MLVRLHIRKPLLRAYLANLFEKTTHHGYQDPVFKVTKTVDFGRLLCSMVRYSNRKKPAPVEALTFQLPWDRSLQSAPAYHLYFSKEDTLKLNDYLEVIFNLHFDRYYLKGKEQGFQQKDIISTFIQVHHLTGLTDVAGSLKKRRYREEARVRDELFIQLKNAAYHRHASIIFDADQVVKTTVLNY